MEYDGCARIEPAVCIGVDVKENDSEWRTIGRKEDGLVSVLRPFDTF